MVYKIELAHRTYSFESKEAALAFQREVAEAEIIEPVPVPPVDRTQQELTDGSPVPADRSHTADRGDGQQRGYVVLTEAERKKGFVRPVRDTYRHAGVRPKYPTRELTADEKKQTEGCDYVLFEEYPKDRPGAIGCYWTKERLNTSA